MKQDSFICPKLKKADEVKEYNLSAIFNVAAGNRSQFREMFEKTHTPIILYDINGFETTEESVFKKFDYNYPGNQAVVIEGETGTGKSEICVKLVYLLSDAGWEIVHIHKNMDLLTMILHLLEFYKEFTGRDYPKSSEFRTMKSELMDPNKRHSIAKVVVGNFFAKDIFQTQENKNEIVRYEQIIDNFEKLFIEKIGKIIREQQVTDFQVEFITRPDVNRYKCVEQLLELIDETINLDEDISTKIENLLEFVNSRLWIHLNSYFDTPKIDEIMDAISIAARDMNKRVVMVIEDLKIASLDLQKLLRYMERDESDDRWDFLIAGTSDIIEIVKKEATRRDRFHFFRTNKKDETQVRFLTEDNSDAFAKKYFSFLYDNFKSECKYCNKCANSNMKMIFPYNNEFLRRVFSKLNDKKPRTYIQKLYAGIKHYLNTGETPTNASEIKRLRREFLEYKKEIHDENLKNFISFYYKEEKIDNKAYYRIHKAFFSFFNIPMDAIPDAVVDNNFVNIPKKEKEFQTTLDGSKIEIREQQTQAVKIKEDKNVDIIEELKSKYKIYLEQAHFLFNATKAQLNSDYLELNSLFKKGIKELLQIFTNDFSLSNHSKLKYKYGVNEYPIYHKNESLDQSVLSIHIDLADLPETLLANIILLGKAVDDKIRLDVNTKISLCKNSIPIIINIASFWRQDFMNYLYKQFRGLHSGKSKEKEKIEVEDILSSFTIFVFSLGFPYSMLESKIIYDTLNDNEKINNLYEQIVLNCEETIKVSSKKFKEKIKYLFDLFSEFIFGTGNIQFKSDVSFLRNYEQLLEHINKINKTQIKYLDRRLIFENTTVSEIFLAIKEIHLEIDRKRKVENIEIQVLTDLFENLNKEEINNTKKIIKENYHLIENLTAHNKAHLQKLERFVNIDHIYQICDYFEQIYNRLFFSGVGDEQFLQCKLLTINEYLFLRWLIKQEGIQALLYFSNNKFHTEDEEITELIDSINKKMEGIFNAC